MLGYTYQQLKGHKSGGEPSIISETATGRSGSTLKGVENLRICTRLTCRAIAVGTGSRLDDVLLSNPGEISPTRRVGTHFGTDHPTAKVIPW